MRLDSLINRAFELIDNPQSDWKHFSFLVRKNNVLSTGWNYQFKTHPLAVKFGYKYPYIHSEISAITKFPQKVENLKKCVLVNVRIGNNNKPLLSRPCQYCQKLIKAFGIGKVYYSNEYGLFEEFISSADGLK